MLSDSLHAVIDICSRLYVVQYLNAGWSAQSTSPLLILGNMIHSNVKKSFSKLSYKDRFQCGRCGARMSEKGRQR
jgi:hypothetical protein